MSAQTKLTDKQIQDNILYDRFLMFYSEMDSEQKKKFKAMVRYYKKQILVNYDHHTTVYLMSRLCHWLNIPEDNK